MKRIVVAEPIHEDGLDLLRGGTDVDVVAFDAPAPQDALRDAARDAHAILVRTIPLGADILSGAPNLEIVSKHGVGCDNIDVAHMTERGLPVTISADANATSVAEHTLMLMLACAKRLTEQDTACRAADWAYRQKTQAFELRRKTVLIIGMGRIGQRVAKLCDAFGMHVVGYDPASGFMAYDRAESLDDAIRRADVISVHTPLLDETRGIIDAGRLSSMKRGAILINCARGGVVDEVALLPALEQGPLAMYGSDVFEVEPVETDNPLFSLSNTIVTAHSAAMTAESKRAMAVQSAENILAHFHGSLDPTVVFNSRELGL